VSGHCSYRLSVLEVQDVRIDPSARRVWRAEREIVLSRKEYDLLHALASRPGDIVSRDELMRDVWGASFWTSSKTIDVHLGWVRRKLGDDSRRPMLIGAGFDTWGGSPFVQARLRLLGEAGGETGQENHQQAGRRGNDATAMFHGAEL